jgi:hypothetical protein
MKTTCLTGFDSDRQRGLLVAAIRELTRGNEREALESFHSVLSGADDPVTAALCSARLLIINRQFEEAASVLEDLLTRSPATVEAHLLLGIVHRETYRLFDAIGSFRAVLVLEPSNERAGEALRELLDVQEP